jgi:hypothetical protein
VTVPGPSPEREASLELLRERESSTLKRLEKELDIEEPFSVE